MKYISSISKTMCLLALPLAAQSWEKPTCSVSATPSGSVAPGGVLLVGHEYSNWCWKDPSGVVHSFPGKSSNNTKFVNINGVGLVPVQGQSTVVTNLDKVQATDGSEVYLSTVDGKVGNVYMKNQIYPKYKVLSIIYAPPGAGSAVNYSKGSGVGTASSVGHSFSKDLDLVATVGNRSTLFEGSIGFGWSSTTSDEKSISVNSLDTLNKQWVSTADGIDHDQDIVEIWLNPAVDMTVVSPTQATWTLANNPGDPVSAKVGADVVYLTIAQLMGRAPITNPYQIERLQRDWPGGGALTGPGTDSDFHEIAKQNPYWALASGYAENTFTPDPARFTLAKCPKINYGPSNSMGNSTNYVSQSQTTNSYQKAFSKSYSVKASFGWNMGDLFSLAASGRMTWTDVVTDSNSNSASSSAEFTIHQPSQSWKGPSDIVVYTDNIYGTFLFTYLK